MEVFNNNLKTMSTIFGKTLEKTYNSLKDLKRNYLVKKPETTEDRAAKAKFTKTSNGFEDCEYEPDSVVNLSKDRSHLPEQQPPLEGNQSQEEENTTLLGINTG